MANGIIQVPPSSLSAVAIADGLTKVVQAAGAYLSAREHRLAREAELRAELAKLDVGLKTQKIKSRKAIRYFELQLADRRGAREDTTSIVIELIRAAERAQARAVELEREGSPDLARQVHATAEAAIQSASTIFLEKFPSGPLAVLD